MTTNPIASTTAIMHKNHTIAIAITITKTIRMQAVTSTTTL